MTNVSANVFNQEETKKMAIELIIILSCSIIFLIFTLYCYLKFPQLQNTQFKLVTRILLSDLIYSLVMISVPIFYYFYQDSPPLAESNNFLCQLEAFISNFAILSSCAWTSVICHTLYQQVCKQNDKIYYFTYIFVGYMIPICISYMPFFFDGYGISYPMPQTNCFYNANLQETEFHIYITIFYYVPIWVAFSFNTIIMVLVVREIRRQTDDIAAGKIYILFIYPAILFFCWVVVFIYFYVLILFFFFTIKPGIVSQFDVMTQWWCYLAQFLCNIIGLLDALSYCFTEVFQKITFDGCSLVLKKDKEIKDEIQRFTNQL